MIAMIIVLVVGVADQSVVFVRGKKTKSVRPRVRAYWILRYRESLVDLVVE